MIADIAWNITDTITAATEDALDQARNLTADDIDKFEVSFTDLLEDATEDVLRELELRTREDWAIHLLADAPEQESSTSVIVLSSAAGFVASYVALTLGKKCTKSDEDFMRA